MPRDPATARGSRTDEARSASAGSRGIWIESVLFGSRWSALLSGIAEVIGVSRTGLGMKRKLVLPSLITSPGRRRTSVIRAPLTKVPFRLPRSRTCHFDSTAMIAAWTVETSGSLTTTCAASQRPRRIVRLSGERSCGPGGAKAPMWLSGRIQLDAPPWLRGVTPGGASRRSRTFR